MHKIITLSRSRPWAAAKIISLSFFTVLSVIYFFAIPIGESPDEPGHLQCIQQVAVLNRIPIVEPKPTGEWWQPGVILSGRMCYHMPAYYVLAGVTQKLLSALTNTSITVVFPESNEAFGATGVMFLHPEKTNLWQVGEVPIVSGLRLISIAFGGVMVWISISIAQKFFPTSPLTALFAGILVAGWPQFLFLSRAISNDVLANAMAALSLAVLLDVGKPKRYTVAALWSALAVMAKINMAFVIGVVLLVWFLEMLVLPANRRELWRSGLYGAGIWGAAITVLLLPTIQNNFWLSTRSFSAIHAQASTIEYWVEVGRLTLQSGFARFGWMNLGADDRLAYIWWTVITVFVIVGAWRWWQCRHELRWLSLLIIGAWFAGNVAAYVRINLTVMQPQFRFLQSTLPLLAAFAAAGILNPFSAAIFWQRVSIVLLATGLLLMNLWIIFGVVAPFYGLSV